METKQDMRNPFDIADDVIEKAYPNIYNLEKGMWGHQKVQNGESLEALLLQLLSMKEMQITLL